LRPDQYITQVRNFIWLMICIYQSRSMCLSRITGKIPGSAKLVSIPRRLERPVDNLAIRVREWYQSISRQWLEGQFQHLEEIRLIVDVAKIGCGHQLLIVCLVYRKQAIHIAWTWIKHARGHSSAPAECGSKKLTAILKCMALF
jgi:hypothetical protein